MSRTAMTNEQRRIHRDLASAEKALIASLIWEHPIEMIERRERRVKRLHLAWRHTQEAQR